MNKHYQNGSALPVLVIILVVVILGALGFTFWQRVTENENLQTNQASTNSPATPSVKLKVAKIDDSFPTKLSWSYPENWTIKTEGKGPADKSETTTQTITLTSPSKAIEVRYSVGVNGGYGGSCDPEFAGKIQGIERKSIPDFSKGLFIQFISGSYSGSSSQKEFDGYHNVSAIYSNDDRIQNAKDDGSFCEVYLGGVIELSKTSNMELLGAEIRLKGIETVDQYGDAQPIKDTSTIKDAYKSDEYKDAVKILLSTQQKDK